MTLIRCRVVRPFAFHGRYAGTGERLYLHPDDFEKLRDSGHVERVEQLNGEPVRHWTQPEVR